MGTIQTIDTNRNSSKHVQGVSEYIGNRQTPRAILMNEKDAAAFLNWSVKTLQARRHLCKPPKYRKIGRSVRYVLADLEAFVESCTVEPMA
jgi:predicted DNA-binding transcriptional regulator AlpA